MGVFFLNNRVSFFHSQKARRLLLCLALALLSLFQAVPPAFGENREDIHIAVDPIGHNEGYSAVLYDNTNGLPTSEANAIAETEEGFIWIGSYSGLIRYDGNTFERIDSTSGVASVVSLFVDSRNRLWIGTNDSGAAVMDRGEFRMWGKADGLKSASVRAITEDEKGQIYIATTQGIAVIDAEMNLRMLDDPRISEANIRDLRVGSDGLIYGLNQKGAIFTMKDEEVVFFLDPEEIRVKGVIGFLPDPEQPGNLYLGTESPLVYYGSLEDNFASMTTTDIAPLNYVEHLEYFDGNIWICAGDGIGVIDSSGFHKLENLPMDNSIAHVMPDYEGNLWFTSTRQGVMKIVPNQFSDVYEHYHLSSAVVNSTCMYGDQLFVATDTGLTVIDRDGVVPTVPLKKAVTASGEDLRATDLLKLLEGCRIRSIIRDSKDRLWISTWRKYGLLQFDNGVVTSFNMSEGLFSDSLRAVYERQDGSILVVNAGGVNVIEGDRVTASYGEADGIANTDILTAIEAGNGDFVLGTDGGGIYIIGSGGVRHLGVEDGLSSDVVMRLKYDRARDLIWIVTSNSIGWLTADYRVNIIRKFPYSNNFDMYENNIGEMWILSSNGIYVVPTDTLLENGEIQPVFYGLGNGLPCITTANSYSELTPDGNLYIAGTTGVAKVNIDQPAENVSILKAAVPYVDADGKRIYPDEDGCFTIGPKVQKLTVYSHVFNYSLMEPQVTYHLEGFEDTGSTVRRRDLVPVDYTNLRGGTYSFVMELHDSMGHGNKELSVEIVKEKAFYEQLWFIILVGALVLICLAAVTHFYILRRTRALEKKQQESMAFISEITEAFAKVIDMKDKYTNGHSNRVAKYTAMLAKELGCDDETIERYYRIALLHDIGKIGVPSEVLNKNGKLTDEEFEIIKSHSSKGYEALKDISIMPELATGAGAHHERPDGKGYPNHLSGDEIPRVAQIIAVADCFDAMYSNRPYRKRMNFEKAVSIIKDVSGTQLTPDVVDAFLRLVDKGEFRAPDDHGGGTTESIDNIHKEQNQTKE